VTKNKTAPEEMKRQQMDTHFTETKRMVKVSMVKKM
jgi:hypothetical protein